MNDDVDPVVSDALRRFAESAPQPRGDRMPAVIAGVRRRQRRVMGASAISVVALIAATTIGVQSLRSSGGGGSVPPASPGNQDTPPSFVWITPSTSLSPSNSPSAASPSQTATPSHTGVVAPGEPKPKLTMQVSPARAVAGHQIHVTVTIVNAGTATLAASDFGIGTMIPNDTFDQVPRTCRPVSGGADCPVGSLRAGQSSSFVFFVTLMPSPLSYDNVMATMHYTDGHGQQQQQQTAQRVAVTGGSGPPSPPSSGIPHSPAPSTS